MSSSPQEHGDTQIVQARRERRQRPAIEVSATDVDAVELAAIEGTLHDVDFPPQIIIEVTNACNLKCQMCAHSILTRAPGRMSDDLYDKIVEEIVRENPDTRVWLSFYGEALLAARKLRRFIRSGKEAGLTDLTLNTNGTLLDDERIEWLVHEGLDRLVFSIDGFRPATFEKHRVGAKHADVYAMVPKVIQAARANGNHPEIVIQIIDMPGTHDEIPEFIAFWRNLGAIVKVKDLLGWTGTAVQRPAHEAQRITCPWVMTTFPITSIGEAVLCGTDYDAQVPMGNVRHNTIKELWTKHRHYRRIHMEHRWADLPEVCQKCTDWQIGGAHTYHPDGSESHLRRDEQS